MHEAISFRHSTFFDDLASQPGSHVHMVMIATKPDIIKQVPLYKALKSRGHTVVLVHTGQHYDQNLSGGMLAEFGVEPDCNLNVRGEMYEVVSQIIARLGWVMGELHKRGKIVIPYVHGDTTTAMAASNAGYCQGFAAVHVEAGIRTLTPLYKKFNGHDQFPIADWHQFLQDRQNWERGSAEPYPEQFNTRASEAATGIHLAPVELDREFLEQEGFPGDRVFVVGNSVTDAVTDALKRAHQSTIFQKYPRLLQGDFVRFCVHRRENCQSEPRFRAIFGAMKQLIEAGRGVLLISLIQTERALERYGLKTEIQELVLKYPHFIYSPVWAEYGDVVAAMSKAAVCATDSGSMQEEMNAMHVPCVTLRFGSDRSESIINGGNIIAPPVDSPLIADTIVYAWNNQNMRNRPLLYGTDVSTKCVQAVEQVLAKEPVFRSEEQRLML
jgi:UDP-N-acetylglucosamine 2-epimerase (non-hydrolysing)